jgi:hypothetical protein
MSRTYKGSFTPKNLSKYKGNPDRITYRSSWERDVMVFLDESPKVKKWNSEEFVVRYYYEVDKKYHKYYVDFWVNWDSGQTTLIEVKPKKQAMPPKTKNPKSKSSLNEAFTYIKNRNKWDAAEKVAKDNGYRFVIWTEDELEKMGIKKKQPGKLKKLVGMKPFRKKKRK